MVDDRGHVIEQGRCIASPPRVEVGEWTLVTVRLHEALKKSERRSENGGTVAPAAEPAVAEENPDLNRDRDLAP
jgi:hypothetical protein